MKYVPKELKGTVDASRGEQHWIDRLKFFTTVVVVLGGGYLALGVVAMLAYFPGGLLADRFQARRLLTASLLATSLGGVYFATFPPARHM